MVFWVCIHYMGPGEGRVVTKLDHWNYMASEVLPVLKASQSSEEVLLLGS